MNILALNKLAYSVVALSFILVNCNVNENSDDSLIGSWSLEKWTSTNTEGEVIYPYGDEAIGQLIYLENHRMSLTLSANDRVHFGTFDHTAIDLQLVLDAFDNYFTYVGDYAIDWENHLVKHNIEACLFPDWVGKTQERHFELKGDTLYLKAYNKFGRDHALIWTKVP